jgi:hypothetical protein
MFRFLVIDEDFQVIKVFVAIKTPRSFQKLLKRWPISLSFGFCHDAVRFVVNKEMSRRFGIFGVPW